MLFLAVVFILFTHCALLEEIVIFLSSCKVAVALEKEDISILLGIHKYFLYAASSLEKFWHFWC